MCEVKNISLIYIRFTNRLDSFVDGTGWSIRSMYCTLFCILVRPIYEYNLSFPNVPSGLVPIFPVHMKGQIPSMPGLLFYRHQIPLTLGFAFTDYKSQGSTFDSLILDLLFGKQCGVDQYGK